MSQIEDNRISNYPLLVLIRTLILTISINQVIKEWDYLKEEEQVI